jgi:FkbM family methyltransferase
MHVVERDGFYWQCGDGVHDDHLGFDPHEANLEPVLRGLLEADHVFLDVGAHVGHWTLRLSPQASKVIAIEANPATAEVLRSNIALNGLSNIDLYQTAAWDCEALLRLEDPNGHLRGGSTRTLPDEYGTVMGIQLDRVLVREPEIHLVKLDVEGSDLHALRGMRGLLAKHRPVLFIERHDQYGYYEFSELEALLADLGYVHEPAPGYGGAEYLIARPVA